MLKRARANDITRMLPVVILTSSSEDQDLLNGYALGCNSYIRKPVDFEQLRSTVQQLGPYWLAVNQPPPASLVVRPERDRAEGEAGKARDQQTEQESVGSGQKEGTPYPLKI